MTKGSGKRDSRNGAEPRSRPWLRLSMRVQGVASLTFPLAALFTVLFSVYWLVGEILAAEQHEERAYEARIELALLRNSLNDQQAVERALARLDSLLASEAESAAALAKFKRLTGERLPESSQADLQTRIASLDELEAKLVLQARSDNQQARRHLFGIVVLCGTLGPFGGLFIHLVLSGRLVSRLKLVEDNARRLAHGLPLGPAPGGTDEIAALGQQLDDAAHLLRSRERELRESEHRYRDLFDQAPIPYQEADTEGMIRRFNQAVCALLHANPSQILGRRAWDFVTPEQREECSTSMMARVQAGMETGPFECDYLLEDGTHLTVEIRENLIRNEAGEVTGVRRSVLDVTERNLAALAARKVEQYAMELRNRNLQLVHALDAARDATQAKSRFLASVSHELRTPLNGIIGFSELLYDEKLGPMEEGQREVLADVLSSARHLLQLINDVLDLSKIEAGKMEFRPAPCLLDQLVYEVRDVIRPLADKKNISLTAHVPAGFRATTDPARLKQVLFNYLSNAVKFTPEGGSVTVTVAPEGADCFRLEVEDTGIGISPEQVGSLFQEFHQLPNSRRADQGTGLGLALTRHIVEAQSGTVGVRSQPGRGSVFSAVLPLRFQNSPAGPAANPLSSSE